MAYSKSGLDERVAFLEAIQRVSGDAASILGGLGSIRDRLVSEERIEQVQAQNTDGTPKTEQKRIHVLDAQNQPVIEDGAPKMKTVDVPVMESRTVPAVYGRPREHGHDLPDTERDRRYDYYDGLIRDLITSIPSITLPPLTPPPAQGGQPPRKGA